MVTEVVKQALPQVQAKYVRPPFTETHVSLIEGDEGGGKTCTAVARVRDAYDKDCVRIYCENVLHIKCKVRSYSRRNRIAKIKYNGSLKILRIPQDYRLYSPMRIFCNFHLYGIPYFYIPSFNHILAWLKQNIIIDGWLVVDEAYVGMNARSCMTELGRKLAMQYRQFRKMQLDVIIITPIARQIDFLLRMVPTEHIHCTYNPKTRKITLAIRKKGIKGEQKVDYDATQYWPNFRTNERVIQ